MRNAVMNWFRDRARGAAAHELYDAGIRAAGHPDPRADWAAALTAVRLDGLIEALREPDRTVLRLCCVVGWKAPKVGPLMGMTAKEVERVRDRARRALAREWAGGLGGR